MSLPQITGGYGLGPGEGEALWFNGGLGLLKATGDQTEGRCTALELLAPKGFASPIHIHRSEDEFFVVLSGEVRVQHGDTVMEAVAGSVVYGLATWRMGSMSIRQKPGCSCSSGRRVSRGSSARAGSRPV